MDGPSHFLPNDAEPFHRCSPLQPAQRTAGSTATTNSEIRIQKSEFRNPQFLLHSLTFLWSVLESTASLNQGTQCPWLQAERGADIGRGDLVPTSATRFKRRMVRHVVAG